MPYADMENGPSARDIPWYAHFNTWEELYKAEYEDDKSAMESGQMFRHEVFVEGGGPEQYRKDLVQNLVDALTDPYDFDVINSDGDERSWTKVDRDDELWEAVMSLAYFDWIRKHTDLLDPVMWEVFPDKEK